MTDDEYSVQILCAKWERRNRIAGICAGSDGWIPSPLDQYIKVKQECRLCPRSVHSTTRIVALFLRTFLCLRGDIVFGGWSMLATRCRRAISSLY